MDKSKKISRQGWINFNPLQFCIILLVVLFIFFTGYGCSGSKRFIPGDNCEQYLKRSGLSESQREEAYWACKTDRKISELIKPYIDKITTDNYYEAQIQPKYYDEYGVMHWDKKVQHELYVKREPLEKVMSDNMGKFYIFLNIYYAYKIGRDNKEQNLKDVYALHEYLKKLGVGNYNIHVYFFSPEKFNGISISTCFRKYMSSHKSGFAGHFKDDDNIYMAYKNMSQISSYEDIAEYLNRPTAVRYKKTKINRDN